MQTRRNHPYTPALAFGTVYTQVQRDKQPDLSMLNRYEDSFWWGHVPNIVQKSYIDTIKYCLRVLRVNGAWETRVVESMAIYARLITTTNLKPTILGIDSINPMVANVILTIV